MTKLLPVALARLLLAVVLGLLVCAAVPVAAGWRSGVILSGSMSPALRVGDVVLSRPVPARSVLPGRVVAVRDPARPGRVLVHRLVLIEPDGDLITKGDANQVADSSPVPAAGLIGEVRIRVPRIGLVAVWARGHERGKLVLALAAVMVLGRLAAVRLAPASAVRLPSEPRMPERRPWRQASGPVRHASRRLFRSRRPSSRVLLGLPAVVVLVAVLTSRMPLFAAGFTDDTANAGSSFSGLGLFEDYRREVLADRPIGYYRADDAAGSSVAVDSSGHQADGRYTGVGSAFQVPGSPAGGTGPGADPAVRWPASGQASASADTSMAGPDTFTAEIWFRTTSAHAGRLLNFGDAVSADSYFNDRFLQTTATGAVQFRVGSGLITSAAAGYNDGEWHLATATLSPAGMQLWLDGVPAAADPGTTTGEVFTGYWRIGGDDVYFDGSLDEVAIYLTELPGSTIAAHYAAGTAATAPTGYTAAVLADNPWAFWHLDDAAAATYPGDVFTTVMADAGGQGHPGKYYRLAPRGLVAGGPGALTGTGAAGTSVHHAQSGTGSYPTAVNNPTTFGLELWFRTAVGAAGGQLIGFGNTATGLSTTYDRLVYLRDDGRLDFGIYTGSYTVITSTAAYNDGGWHHLVAGLGAAGSVLYVDGVQVAANGSPGAPENALGYWRWGGNKLNGWPDAPVSAFFTGDLDEIAIYPTQLSSTRVAAHYAANH